MVTAHATILLVEDDPNDVLFMKTALEAAGVENPLFVANNGREALAYLNGTGKFSERSRHPLPYLVLLDLKLPYVMGLEVLKAVRERPDLNSTIVIVLTASTNAADVETAYRLGANAYLVKPSSFEKLKVLIRSVKEFWLVQNQPSAPFSDL